MWLTIRYALLGLSLGLGEWFLMNIAPVLGVVRLVLIVSLIYILRRYSYKAFVIGVFGMFVRDIGSSSFFLPVHILLFVVISAGVHLFSTHVISHKSVSGFVVAGLIGFLVYRVLYGFVLLSIGVNIFSFGLFWREIVVSFIVYISVVIIRNQQWRILRVSKYG